MGQLLRLDRETKHESKLFLKICPLRGSNFKILLPKKKPTHTCLHYVCLSPFYKNKREILQLLGWLANEVSLAWIHERVPRETQPLPDLFFTFFPEASIKNSELLMKCGFITNGLFVSRTEEKDM